MSTVYSGRLQEYQAAYIHRTTLSQTNSKPATSAESTPRYGARLLLFYLSSQRSCSSLSRLHKSVEAEAARPTVIPEGHQRFPRMRPTGAAKPGRDGLGLLMLVAQAAYLRDLARVERTISGKKSPTQHGQNSQLRGRKTTQAKSSRGFWKLIALQQELGVAVQAKPNLPVRLTARGRETPIA